MRFFSFDVSFVEADVHGAPLHRQPTFQAPRIEKSAIVDVAHLHKYQPKTPEISVVRGDIGEEHAGHRYRLATTGSTE